MVAKSRADLSLIYATQVGVAFHRTDIQNPLDNHPLSLSMLRQGFSRWRASIKGDFAMGTSGRGPRFDHRVAWKASQRVGQ